MISKSKIRFWSIKNTKFITLLLISAIFLWAKPISKRTFIIWNHRIPVPQWERDGSGNWSPQVIQKPHSSSISKRSPINTLLHPLSSHKTGWLMKSDKSLGLSRPPCPQWLRAEATQTAPATAPGPRTPAIPITLPPPTGRRAGEGTSKINCQLIDNQGTDPQFQMIPWNLRAKIYVSRLQ